MTCETCPKAWRCIFACEEISKQLAAIEAELEG